VVPTSACRAEERDESVETDRSGVERIGKRTRRVLDSHLALSSTVVAVLEL
jgi:hypothetical protein